MEPSETLKRTPLYSLHREGGAKMVPFGGWEMPVEYSGLIAEHLAVRQAAGLFDVSHMGEFEIEGPGALAFLQRVTCNNVAKLQPGRAQYSALPMENGAPVDDIIVFRRGEERFLVIVNAANILKDFAWLMAQQPQGCTLANRSDEYALIAVQGPQAERIVAALTDSPLAALAYYHFLDGRVADCQAILSRTGYTGEDGFELLVAAECAERLWRQLLTVGQPHGLVPVGLGARDTLRLEARLLLYGNDMHEATTLVEAGLGWIVSLDPAKGDYIGRATLAAQKQSGPARKLVGFEILGRGIARHGHTVYCQDAAVDTVTSGSYAPYLKKSIGLCYLPADRAIVGSEFEIDIRGKRVAAQVVATPFYKRAPRVA